MNKLNLIQAIYKVTLFTLPISAIGLINMITNFLCMMMAASLGKNQLAAGALAIPTYMTMMTITNTIFYAVGILISHQKNNEGAANDISSIVKNGFFLALMLAFPAAFILWNIDGLLRLFGQNPVLIESARGYFHFAALNLFPFLLNTIIYQFYIGTGKPHIPWWIVFFCFPFTLILSYGFILGHFGLPIMGIGGITCANFIVQLTILCLMLLKQYWKEKNNASRYHFFSKVRKPNWVQCRSIFTLGLPIGIQFGGELAAIAAATYLLGFFGTTVLAASQIVTQYTMLVIAFMIGLTQALSILTSEAYAHENGYLIKTYLQAAFVILLFICSLTSFLFLLFPHQLIHFYMQTNIIEVQLNYLATVFFAINAFLLFFDSSRHLLAGVLRGLHESREPMRIGMIAMWLVSLPLSYVMGMVFNLGPIGLRIGFISGFLFAMILLLLRVKNKLSYLSS